MALDAIDNMKFDTITKFGWEQDDKKVKVYLTSLEGVGKIPKENIVCEFEDKSFDLRIQGLNNRNMRLKVPELHAQVELAECKFQIKSNSITITLIKTNGEKHWTDLKPKKSMMGEKESDKAKKPKPVNNENPMGGMMDMMKNMYENGDEGTKRMIAESW